MVVSEDPDPDRDKSADPKPIEHPAFCYPRDYVYRTCSWLERFGVLPRPGGLDDQDAAWVDDAELYFALKGQTQREYAEWKREHSGGAT